MRELFSVLLLLPLLASAPASADEDGARLFTPCRACHSLDPADGSWKAWKLPGDNPRTYAVYVDNKDKVWLTDFSANAIVRFDPVTEKFNSFPSDKTGANVRQLDGKPGETWGGESGNNRLVMIQTVAPV